MYAYAYFLVVHSVQGNDTYQLQDSSGRAWGLTEVTALTEHVTMYVMSLNREKGETWKESSNQSINQYVSNTIVILYVFKIVNSW